MRGVVALDDRHRGGERVRLVEHRVRAADGHLVDGPRAQHVAEVDDGRDAPRVRIVAVHEHVVVVGVVVDDAGAQCRARGARVPPPTTRTGVPPACAGPGLRRRERTRESSRRAGDPTSDRARPRDARTPPAPRRPRRAACRGCAAGPAYAVARGPARARAPTSAASPGAACPPRQARDTTAWPSAACRTRGSRMSGATVARCRSAAFCRSITRGSSAGVRDLQHVPFAAGRGQQEVLVALAWQRRRRRRRGRNAAGRWPWHRHR